MEAPWKHHGTTQRARIWHRYVTLIGHCRWRGCVFTMTAPCGHLDCTIATRWQHVFGTAIAPCLDAKSHKEYLSPTPFAPFFVRAGQAQRMGPLSRISGEIGHGGILGTKPRIPASEATAPFAAACRVAATRGLVVCCDGVILVPSNPPAQKSLRSCHPCHNLPCATAYFRLHQTHHGQPFRVRHLRAQHTGHLGQLPFDAQANV